MTEKKIRDDRSYGTNFPRELNITKNSTTFGMKNGDFFISRLIIRY